ncbi:hypothetical protein D9611_009801 [Ephemerocybe angulata]|nr:hypothetical protein D9611_009801 [Tulosesus angulatus]
METDCNTFRFQDFPSDLTRSIFEASAEDLNWGCALVSKMVKSWVEPILYRQIILDKPTTVSLLHRTIVSSVSSKPPHFFASHVKSLGVFFSNDSWEELMEILATCSGISRLEFTMYLDEDLNRDDLRVGRHRAWEHLRPTSLHIPGTLFLPTHRHFHFLPWEGKTLNPIFTRITHFEID